MAPHKVPMEAPAKRVVLFVADGLRADKIFEDSSRSPFLHSIIQERGRWGVSHSRVPTESRCGHVAIIAGFYEDVSAVTKGWKMNPVEFDSVFNESLHTWAFGSPDILPMFKFGATNPDKIDNTMYDSHFEDFAAVDAGILDDWVFEKVEAMFDSAAKNGTLASALRSDKVVFFLHLLGIDTNGHAHRPYSKEYLENIGRVDRGVKRMTEVFERFFDDDMTAFIYTADHGMSDIGNHGDGNPDNTRTPLVAWGAGIGGPIDDESMKSHSPFSRDWPISNRQRMDVQQADIAPLMALLVGLHFPMNSVGVIPTDYLDGNKRFLASAISTNAWQVMEQFLVKEDKKRRSEPFFQPFSDFRRDSPQELAKQIRSQIADNDWNAVFDSSLSIIRDCLRGLRYYQTYDWLFLRSVVSLGYLGWIFFSLLFVVSQYVSSEALPIELPSVSLLLLLMTVNSLFLLFKEAPSLYYAYTAFPILFWCIVWQNRSVISYFSADVMRKSSWVMLTVRVILYVACLEVLVASYFDRQVLGVVFIGLAVLVPLNVAGSTRSKHHMLILAWVCGCLTSSIFMFFQLSKEEDEFQFIVGVIALLVVATIDLSSIRPPSNTLTTIAPQVLMVILTGIVSVSTMRSLRNKEGLPLANQYGAWILLVSSQLYMWLVIGYAENYRLRLTTIFLGFSPFMILLSINFEILYYSFFYATLVVWTELESALYGDEIMDNTEVESRVFLTLPKSLNENPQRALKARDVRIALGFLFFINCAFFGTGNVASLASFQISSVYRLTTIFDPVLMGLLLSIKILIPFFVLSAVFGVLSIALELPPFSLFLFTVATTDITTLNFFFLVRDDGSWLEIGTSISHFVIACLFEVFSILLFCVSWILIKGVFVRPLVVSKRQKKK